MKKNIAPICLAFLGSALWPEMELLVPSLPAMKAFFGVSDGQIQQLLTANFVGFLCGVLLAGPICDSWGRKRGILWGMVLFLATSAWAALAQDYPTMMLARFFQGLAITLPIIGELTMLIEITAGAQQIFWMSISSASVTICMAAAPLLGALINAEFGFRGNLWAIFIAGFIGVIPVLIWVPENLAANKRMPLRIKAVAANYWLLLKNPSFMGLSFVMAALAAAYWIYTGVSALYMVDYLKMNPALFGNYQGPIVGTFAACSIGITWVLKKTTMKTCLWVGTLLMLIGVGTLFVLTVLGIENALLTTIFMMFFVGGMVPANSLLLPSALNLLPPHLQGSGNSIIQAMRLVLASIGTGILGFVYTGPFLPVVLIMLVMFVLSTVLQWKLRDSVSELPSDAVIGGH